MNAPLTSAAAMIDHTHDPAAASWVPSAQGHAAFPVQNLPLGVFSPPGGTPRIGTAIGDLILDLAALAGALPAGLAEALTRPSLNALVDHAPATRRALRHAVFALLTDEGHRAAVAPHLHPAADCALHLPFVVGDYTDFYVGIHHATNIGKQFRPDNPLLPNYKHVPIGYHGRASSIVVSGTDVRRPRGQQSPPDDKPGAAPTFGPSTMLDYELELGLVIGKQTSQGEPVPIAQAREHMLGVVLVNDWSARDVQKWEYQPLGPFLAKNFATSISPFIVTMDALEPFRCAAMKRPEGDPTPLPYLFDAEDQARGGLAITLEVWLQSEKMRAAGTPAMRLSRGSFTDMYWTLAQLLTHHTSNGCNLSSGDLLASGTISGVAPDARGCLLELTWAGRDASGKPLPRKPIQLPSGEARTFLQDGDEVIMRGFAEAPGARRIGLGECRGKILPAL